MKRLWWGKEGWWRRGVAQRSQCLLGNHSDCLSFPKSSPRITPPSYSFLFSLPFISCSQASILGEGGTGFCIKVSFWHLRVLFFLLTCKMRGGEHLHKNPPSRTFFCLLSEPSYPSFHYRSCCLTWLVLQADGTHHRVFLAVIPVLWETREATHWVREAQGTGRAAL